MDLLIRRPREYYVGLAAAINSNPGLVGNKAFKCAELKDAGMPVPDGNVITSQFFDDTIEIIARKHSDIRHVQAWHMASAEQKSNWREKIANTFRAEISRIGFTNSYPDTFSPVAVRSSGTSEDSDDQSFAGLYDTVLGPSNLRDLQDAIISCLLSAFGDRVIAALAFSGLSDHIPSVAVFIQELILAESAGVCFGAHDDIEYCRISSVEGFGERLVSGEENASIYIVDVGERFVVDRKIVSQQKKLVYEDKKMSLQDMSSSSQAIPDSVLLDLSDFAHFAAKKFGAPQDMEWVYSNDRLWIVQSRPITKSLSGVVGAGYKDIITREYGVQYCQIAVHSLIDQGSSWVNAHVPSQTWLPERQPNVVAYMKEIENWRMISDVASLISLHSWRHFVSAFKMHAEYYDRTTQMVEEQIKHNSTRKSLLDSYRVYQDVAKMYCSFIWQGWAAGDVAVQRLEQTLEKYVSNKNERDVIRTYAKTPCRRPIAVGIFPDAASKCDLSEASLRSLYADYSWIPCLDLHHDKSEYDRFVEIVKSHKNNPPIHNEIETPTEILSHLHADVTEVSELLREILYIKDARDDVRRKGVARVKYSLFTRIAEIANCDVNELSFWTEAEIFEFLFDKRLPNTNDINARLSGRFSVFVDKDGCVGCLSGDLAERRSESLPLIVANSRNYPGAAFGMPAHTGQARGIAKIVRSTHDLAKVSQGDIMIAKTTNAEYLAKILDARGVVTDEGDEGSHAAIECRERDIPCLVKTIDGTSMFKDGDEVYLDATSGWIKREDLL